MYIIRNYGHSMTVYWCFRPTQNISFSINHGGEVLPTRPITGEVSAPIGVQTTRLYSGVLSEPNGSRRQPAGNLDSPQFHTLKKGTQ
jgi:hypothetical protein